MAGAGATDDARNRRHPGQMPCCITLERLSAIGGELRPGIVHRLDRATSGLMVVAKNDESHRRLAKAIQLSRGAQDVPRAGPRLAQAGSRHHSKPHQPPLPEAHAMTTKGFGGRDAGHALCRQAQARRPPTASSLSSNLEDRNRTHAPDSRSHVVAWASGGGRRALRRAGRVGGRSRINAARPACLQRWPSAEISCIRRRSS